jgi:hypothetical protein
MDSFKKTQQPKQNPKSKSRNLIYRQNVYNEDIAVDLTKTIEETE